MAYLYNDEGYAIIGAAQKVYNTLGSGFVEAIYQDALEVEFKRRNIPYEREKELYIYYDGIRLDKTFKPDFICYKKIIVEIKAVMELDNMNRSHVYNYLKASQMKVGYLFNFGSYPELEFERKNFMKNFNLPE